MKKQLYSLMAAVTLTGFAVAASATPIINFDQINANLPRGTISYGGNGGALTGTNLSFDQISLAQGGGILPAGHSDILTCSNCSLSFTTGNNTQEGPSTWTFGEGGNFTLTGTVTDPNTNATVASGTLLDGSFADTPAVHQSAAHSFFFNGFGPNDTNGALAAYFGFDPTRNFDFANTAISFDATFDGSAFSGTATASDLNDKAAVPAPAGIGLLGFGLLAFGAWFRRGRKRSGGVSAA